MKLQLEFAKCCENQKFKFGFEVAEEPYVHPLLLPVAKLDFDNQSKFRCEWCAAVFIVTATLNSGD